MEQIDIALRGPQGPAILRALARLGTTGRLDGEDLSALPLLAKLGLGRPTASGIALDELGQKCADAAREYVFWTARERRLHCENSLPVLSLSNFENKRVLEIGSGWGCNLFRLQEVTPHARGREIDEVYVRFTPIFARIEGVDPPAIDVGEGERLPYADGSFDRVVMFSALQYMDVEPAVKEIARVLAPGGHLLTSQPALPMLFDELRDAVGTPRTFLAKSVTLLNSLAYELFGRRLRGNQPNRSTARPVYLSKGRLISIFKDAGLRFLPDQSGRQATDHILVAEKPVQ